MKKRNLLFTSLVCVLSLTSCTNFLSKNYDNKEKVLEAVDKINDYDYTQDFSSFIIYSKSIYKSDYDFGKYADQGMHKDFATIEEEEVLKVDFSNQDDLYIYYFSTKTYSFLSDYDSTSGTGNYARRRGAISGYQFYKNNDKYIYNNFLYTSIKSITSLDLDEFYIDSSKVNELKSLEGRLSTGLTNDEGKLLFNYYLMPKIESQFRINEDILDNYVNDGSNIYSLSANDTDFVISGNFKDVKYNYSKSIANDDGKYGSRQTVLQPGNYDTDDEAFTFTTAQRNWVSNFETVEGTCTRSLNVNYSKGGWLTKAKISDNRNVNEYERIKSVDKLYTSLEAYTDFNVVIPHSFLK